MRYDTDACTIVLSASELCTLALRGGDLDAPSCRPYEVDNDGKMYYRLQEEAGAYYAPRVELTNTRSCDGIYFTVSTFADGIIKKDGTVTVDKIRCVHGKGRFLPPDSFTLAMLKCSAYFFAVQEELGYIEGRVSTYDTDKHKLKYLKYRFLRSELEEFYLSLLKKVSFRARLAEVRATVERPSAAAQVFPYPELREGQEIMIHRVYSAAKHGRRLFATAPTGTGKTVSALFPAIRALGEGYCDRIFYLTPKISTRREAFAAAARLNTAGNLQRTVMISAKEQICPMRGRGGCGTEGRCSGAACEYARGYYDRLEGALRELLENFRGYSRGLICSVAEKYRLCPYELSLDLSELCDVLICDYNYAFDMSVYFRRYFGPKGAQRGEKYMFLIDEAHNLGERAREMYTCRARLSDFELLPPMTAEGEDRDVLGTICAPVARAISGVKKLCRDELVKDAQGNERGFYIDAQPPQSIASAMAAFIKKGRSWLRVNEAHPQAPRLSELVRLADRYISVLDYFDESFRFYAQIENGDILVQLYCLDPSDIMNTLLSRAVSSIMFSATLTPTDYFCNILGGAKNADSVVLPSPFPRENLCVTVADYINTRYDVRADSAKKFATVIAATVSPKAGNYIAYFPSYSCLEQTYEAFCKKYPRVETVVQKRNMTARQREEFLSAFREDEGHLRVGFCVLGGTFSEGVDLPGSRLIGSIIFGVGLPGLSNERNIIKEYFDLKSDEGIGYDYAYTFQGMNNVLQAAGRVIRRESDRGVVVLADDRYATPKYRTLFPEQWQDIKYAGNASSLAEIIRRFWQKQPE